MMTTTAFSLKPLRWYKWPDVAIPVVAAPEMIPENHTLRVDVRLERDGGRFVLHCDQTFLTYSDVELTRDRCLPMPYRRTFRLKVRTWWKCRQHAAEYLNDKQAKRDFRRFHKLGIADQNLLQGYYGRRRSSGRNRVWKFARPTPHQRRDILKFIAAVRNSLHDSIKHYTQGNCYGFAKLLRHQFPEAVIWYDRVEGHVYTRIGSHWFDIRGIHYGRGDKRPLDHREGQRPHRWKPHNG